MKERIRRLDGQNSGPSKPVRLVVAALILRQWDGSASASGSAREVLVCQRRPDQPMSLKWEFPGGKIEPGESPQQALARELDEELGITAVIGRQITKLRHKYRNGGTIELEFFEVTEFSGEIANRIFHEVRWAPLSTLTSYDFLAADLGLIRDLAEGKLL